MSQLSAKEMEILPIFKARIKDLLPDMDDFVKEDIHLMRWLRARALNVDQAELMLRKSMKWRKENNIDDVLAWEAPETIVAEFPWRCCGYDKFGCPLVVIPFGKWRMRQVVEDGHTNDFLRGSYFCNEWQIALMKHHSTKERIIYQSVQIIDLEDYSIFQFMSKLSIDAFAEEVKSMEANYPELLRKVFLINAPRIFSFFYNLIKRLLSKETLAKVNIYNSNSTVWKAALLKEIDPDNLPSEYGGANTNCENFDKMMTVLEPHRVEPKFVHFKENEFISAVIGAGELFKVDYQVPVADSILSWAFTTEDFCTTFSILDEEDKAVVNCKTVDSHKHTQKGNLICPSKGKYILCFDNSLDNTRSKKLRYAVCLKEGSPPEISESKE